MSDKFDVTFFAATPSNPKASYGKVFRLAFADFHKKIQKEGFSWSPGVFIENRRRNDDFKYAEVIACDIDGGVSPDEAKRRIKELGLSASITLSKSHNKLKNPGKSNERPPEPRIRIAIPLSERVSTQSVYLATMLKLRKTFPEMDKACLDPARMFFASTGEGETVLVESGKPFKVVQSSRSYEELKASIKKEKLRETTFENSPEKIVMSGPFRQNAQHFFEHARSGLPGEFNDSLNKAAYELARSGYARTEVHKMLEAASPRLFDSKDEATFESGFSAGQKKGIYKNVVIENDQPVLDLTKEQIVLRKSKMIFDELWSDQFLRIGDRSGSIRLYSITPENTLVINIQEKLLSDAVVELSKRGFPISPRKVADLIGYWVSFLPILRENPPLLLFKSDPRLCFHRADFDPASGTTKRFDSFTSRLNNPEEFMAFLYSLFVPESYRQQYLWIWGGGGDGKGAISRVLRQILGEAYCSERAPSHLSNDKHWTSSLVGKRLVVFPDTSATAFVRSDIFMEITGGDPTKVEEKFKSAFTAVLDVKLLFLSNSIPQISNQKSDMRRAIVSHISPLDASVDPSYESDLYQERAAIFFKCQKAYDKLVRNHGPIRIDESNLREVTDDYAVPYEGVFKRHLKIKKTGKVTPDDLHTRVSQDLKANGLNFEDFKKWLFSTYKIKISRKHGDNSARHFYGLTLLSDFDSADQAEAVMGGDDFLPPFRDEIPRSVSYERDDFDFGDDFEGSAQ